MKTKSLMEKKKSNAERVDVMNFGIVQTYA